MTSVRDQNLCNPTQKGLPLWIKEIINVALLFTGEASEEEDSILVERAWTLRLALLGIEYILCSSISMCIRSYFPKAATTLPIAHAILESFKILTFPPSRDGSNFSPLESGWVFVTASVGPM